MYEIRNPDGVLIARFRVKRYISDYAPFFPLMNLYCKYYDSEY